MKFRLVTQFSDQRFQRRRDFPGDVNQCGDQRCHRIALRNHHSHAVGDDRIDDRNGSDCVRQTKRLRELGRHHAGPASGFDVGVKHDDRIGCQRRGGLGTDGAERAIDDAAVLHVRRQRQSGTCPTSFQVTSSRSPNIPSGDVSNR